MDGIVLLKEDHKTAEKLFKQFEKAGDNAHAEKRKIADKVIDELTTHTWIEERRRVHRGSTGVLTATQSLFARGRLSDRKRVRRID
ncbi:hypothetical protein ACFWAX_41655, partial [Streptomyces sp. NPDC059956]